MMRLTWATVVAILISAPTIAQQPPAGNPDARIATKGKQQALQPFPPLNAAERAQLIQVLTAWESQSKSTKTLDCKFTRWHYDLFAAPAGVHANRADGVIKFAAPDQGLFRVDSLVFFNSVVNGKPQFKAITGEFGEYWVCNGKQLIEYDRKNQQCKIQQIPPQMQGTQITNGPLPFVFNLDAAEIQDRYWVRLQKPPQEGIVLVEAHPKHQQDRANYKFVQIALDQKTMLPRALLMYAPNFNPKNAVKYDHYEFTDLGRNKIGAGFQKFLRNFIPQKPPASWKIIQLDAAGAATPPANGQPQNGQPNVQQQNVQQPNAQQPNTQPRGGAPSSPVQGLPSQGVPQRPVSR